MKNRKEKAFHPGVSERTSCPSCGAAYTHDPVWGRHVCRDPVTAAFPSVPSSEWLAAGDTTFEKVIKRSDRFEYEYDDDLIRELEGGPAAVPYHEDSSGEEFLREDAA